MGPFMIFFSTLTKVSYLALHCAKSNEDNLEMIDLWLVAFSYSLSRDFSQNPQWSANVLSLFC